jgi:hypothetical protein
MNAQRMQYYANYTPGFDPGTVCSGRLQVRLGRQRSRGYGDECFKIQLEIVVSASGANVSSMARDSAGNPI